MKLSKNAGKTSERTPRQKSQLPIVTGSEPFDLFLIGKKNIFVANHSFSFDHQVCVTCSSESSFQRIILRKFHLQQTNLVRQPIRAQDSLTCTDQSFPTVPIYYFEVAYVRCHCFRLEIACPEAFEKKKQTRDKNNSKMVPITLVPRFSCP